MTLREIFEEIIGVADDWQAEGRDSGHRDRIVELVGQIKSQLADAKEHQ